MCGANLAINGNRTGPVRNGEGRDGGRHPQGYAINPGAGNRDYWTGGVAVTRQFGDRLLVGLEADRQGADNLAGSASTSLGIGAIYDLPGPLRLLASGGPTFDDEGRKGFHAFAALGLDF